MSRVSQTVYRYNYSIKNSSTFVDDKLKLKALLVLRRIVLWQILCMDKCVYAVHLIQLYAWFDATRVFAFAHVCHTHVPFKLWMICTV